MFYIAHHTYDIRFVNDVDELYRFASRRERDEFSNGERFDGNYHLEPVTRAEARRYLPGAFKEFVNEGTDYKVPNWWTTTPFGVECWNFWEHSQI